MKGNTHLQRDAVDELKFDPSLDASKIGVIANVGMVILTGKVSSDAEMYAGSEAEGIRFFTGLLHASAISAALWLTVGGVAWWARR